MHLKQLLQFMVHREYSVKFIFIIINYYELKARLGSFIEQGTQVHHINRAQRVGEGWTQIPICHSLPCDWGHYLTPLDIDFFNCKRRVILEHSFGGYKIK